MIWREVQIGTFSVEAPRDSNLSTVILVGPSDELVADPDELPGFTARPFQKNFIATMEQVEDTVTPESYARRQQEGLRKAGREASPNGIPEKGRTGGRRYTWLAVGTEDRWAVR